MQTVQGLLTKEVAVKVNLVNGRVCRESATQVLQPPYMLFSEVHRGKVQNLCHRKLHNAGALQQGKGVNNSNAVRLSVLRSSLTKEATADFLAHTHHRPLIASSEALHLLHLHDISVRLRNPYQGL